MTRSLWRGFAVLGAFVCLTLWATTPATSQARPQNVEWRSYGADLANTRYSPLDQINAANFKNLEVAWRFKTDNLGPRPEFNLESTPLMANGVLYSTAGTRRAVVALNAETGEMKWVFSLDEGKRGEAAPRRLSGRGLSYWTDGPGGKDERIIYVTPGYQMIALNAATGRPVPTFGKAGMVDLKLEDDQLMDPITGEIGLHAAPIIVNDVVVIGAAHLPGGAPKSRRNEKGYVRGYDARTGKRLWIFHTIPQPGEAGNETWLKDSWAYTGNTGNWGQMSADADLGYVYLATEMPTGDYYGGHRPGNNLFADSIVAIEVKTGKRIWYFQGIHHDMWDWDFPAGSILGTITVNGRQIKALAQPSKQGFLYVFDRTNGQPVWPIEERPVPKGDVPGEWYSPTQPFPTKPPAFARQAVTVDDLIDFTPELHAQALKAIEPFKNGPIFNPPTVSKIGGPVAGLTIGTTNGGTNWPGGGYDPETHTVFLPASNASIVPIGLIEPPEGFSDIKYVLGRAGQPFRVSEGPGFGSAADFPQQPSRRRAAPEGPPPGASAPPAAGAQGSTSVQGLSILKPPYGLLSAINLDKGEITWQVPHGDTPDFVRNHAALKGMNIPKTGQSGAVGLVVTRTLVIMGDPQITTTPDHPRGAMLRAYDKATGKQVGAIYLPAPQSGSPMTYRVNGRQYIVVAVSGGAYSGEYIAFALPATD